MCQLDALFVWLCFSSAEKLRRHFVEHKGKKVIEVVRPEWSKGNPRNNWPDVFPEFAQQIKERTKGDVHDIVVSDFSTSDDLSRICSQITLMDCMKSYFTYTMVRTRFGGSFAFLEFTSPARMNWASGDL